MFANIGIKERADEEIVDAKAVLHDIKTQAVKCKPEPMNCDSASDLDDADDDVGTVGTSVGTEQPSATAADDDVMAAAQLVVE